MRADISSFTVQQVHSSSATKYMNFNSIIPLSSTGSFALQTTWFVTAIQKENNESFLLIWSLKYHKLNAIQDKTFKKFSSDIRQDLS